MAYQILTTQQYIDRNIAIIESKLNQTVPSVDKAYNRVLAIVFGTIQTETVKLSVERALQCLALTASGQNLDDIGREYSIIRKPATAAVLRGTIPTTTSVTLPQTVSLIGDNNSVRYFPNSSYASVANIITADVTADELGVSGNLEVADTLQMNTQIAGSSTTMTVTSIITVGAEEESDDAYRQRILTEIRTVKGGGNSSDHRKWAEEVAGVFRAFPYSGLPIDDPGTDAPLDRTVYVEANTDIDSDGIAPPSLLTSVRDSINTDPETGLDRSPLGLNDDQLYVVSIYRNDVYFEVRGLDVPVSDEASVKSNIESALVVYARSVAPYIDGLDFEGDRNDVITDLVISSIVQSIVADVGGSASGVAFGFSPGVFIPAYTLAQGETLKSAGVTYVA